MSFCIYVSKMFLGFGRTLGLRNDDRISFLGEFFINKSVIGFEAEWSIQCLCQSIFKSENV